MTKHHRAGNHGEEHRKGQSVPGRRWDTERLRGVTFGARVFLHRYLGNLACGLPANPNPSLPEAIIIILVINQAFR